MVLASGPDADRWIDARAGDDRLSGGSGSDVIDENADEAWSVDFLGFADAGKT
jgi:hypothetical protein